MRKKNRILTLQNPQLRIIICEQKKKQDPDAAESALSRHRCVPKIASRETIKPKDTTALHKTGGPPWEQPGGERAAGFCDSLPAIPIVFADGSLRTNKFLLVGKRLIASFFDLDGGF